MADAHTTPPCFDSGDDPGGRPTVMFVDIVQQRWVDAEQTPVLRPVFLEPHGVAHARREPVADLPDDRRIGIFDMGPLAAWVRFSSDTLPSSTDLRTTCGIGMIATVRTSTILRARPHHGPRPAARAPNAASG